ncbi:MAG: hypothetical protein WDN28_12715 [Chthoniobacter sp.]
MNATAARGAFISRIAGRVRAAAARSPGAAQNGVHRSRPRHPRASAAGSPSSRGLLSPAGVRGLRKFNALTDYTDELTQQLAAQPESAALVLRLAEAFERTNPAKSLEYCRRLVQLTPRDAAAHARLAQQLVTARKMDEAVGVWKTAFALDPQVLFGLRFLPHRERIQGHEAVECAGRDAPASAAAGNPLEGLAFGVPDVSDRFDQVARELQQEGKVDEAIQVWRASLVRTPRDPETGRPVLPRPRNNHAGGPGPGAARRRTPGGSRAGPGKLLLPSRATPARLGIRDALHGEGLE